MPFLIHFIGRPLQKQRNHQIVFVCVCVCVCVCVRACVCARVFVYFCQGAAFGYSVLLHVSFFYFDCLIFCISSYLIHGSCKICFLF